jgi:hypothetical protein
MRKGILQLSAILVLAVTSAGTPASAAPVGAGDVRGLKAGASEASAVDQVHRRRCWRDDRGRRHCRRQSRNSAAERETTRRLDDAINRQYLRDAGRR